MSTNDSTDRERALALADSMIAWASRWRERAQVSPELAAEAVERLAPVVAVRLRREDHDPPLRDEDGAPYRDARMLLTHGIILAADMRDQGNGAMWGAEDVARHVALSYPSLAARMAEPARIGLIETAIACSGPPSKKQPAGAWVAIAAAWDGIEAVPRVATEWANEWARWAHGPRARARLSRDDG